MPKGSKKGFTLIELLVVCAIIIVVSAIVLIDNNKFGGDITLENFAYSVALSIRQAQVYGIAVERFGSNCSTGSTSACFASGYGMHFALSNPTAYILFADEDSNGVYDAAAVPSEVVQANSITQGFSITGLCVIANTSQNAACQSVSQIDVLYVRPEPEAYITGGGAGNSCKKFPRNCNYEAQITLTSPKGDTRSVVVDATGQISVQLQ